MGWTSSPARTSPIRSGWCQSFRSSIVLFFLQATPEFLGQLFLGPTFRNTAESGIAEKENGAPAGKLEHLFFLKVPDQVSVEIIPIERIHSGSVDDGVPMQQNQMVFHVVEGLDA